MEAGTEWLTGDNLLIYRGMPVITSLMMVIYW